MAQKPDIWSWLGFKSPDWSRRQELGKWFGDISAGIIILSAFVLLVMYFGLMIRFILWVWSPSSSGLGPENYGPYGAYAYGLALMAIITLPLAVWRAIVAQKTANIQQADLTTDRINKAVENLGAMRQISRADGGNEVFEPNIPVRIGGILALERIGRDNPDFHIQIVNILTGYIRVERPAPADGGQDQLRKLLAPNEDVLTALKVIGRRDASLREIEKLSKFKPDLSQVDLANADLSDLDFSHCNFNRSYLEGCDLRDAKLHYANFVGAKLHHANLVGAKLHHANLLVAELHNANFVGAKLHNADLFLAELHNADLDRAELHHADLKGAKLHHANLEGAGLHNANLSWAELHNADLRWAEGLTQSALYLATGNSDTLFDEPKESEAPLYIANGFSKEQLEQLELVVFEEDEYLSKDGKGARKTGSNYPDEDEFITDEELGIAGKDRAEE